MDIRSPWHLGLHTRTNCELASITSCVATSGSCRLVWCVSCSPDYDCTRFKISEVAMWRTSEYLTFTALWFHAYLVLVVQACSCSRRYSYMSYSLLSFVCMVTLSAGMDEPGKVVNPACGQLNRENEYFSVPVRAQEFGLARQVRPSRPASARSFSILKLNLAYSVL